MSATGFQRKRRGLKKKELKELQAIAKAKGLRGWHLMKEETLRDKLKE